MDRALSARVSWLGVVAACVLGGTFLSAHTAQHGPPCLFRTFYHVPCPGCGLTRSLEALWRADPVVAFRYHPFGPPLFVFCCIYLLMLLFRRPISRIGMAPEDVIRALLRPKMQLGLGGLFLGVWFLRLGLMLAGNRFFLW